MLRRGMPEGTEFFMPSHIMMPSKKKKKQTSEKVEDFRRTCSRLLIRHILHILALRFSLGYRYILWG